jgi:uncharacterized protein
MKKSKLKRRLRKKLRVGEFREFGFQVEVTFKPNLDKADSDKFYTDFIGLIEANKFFFGGGSCPESLRGFITASENYQSPTEAQREKIKKWLESRHEIADCEVGKLVDAWYDN